MKKLVICGDAIEVSEKINELKDKVGKFDTLTYVGVDWKDKNLAKKSLHLFSEKVSIKI
jgi:hypothetical protein